MNTGKIYDHPKFYDLEDFEGEIWVDVCGFEGLYKVSNLGRIKRLLKTTGDVKHRYNYVRILPMQKVARKRNYHKVDLFKDNKIYYLQVHRIVAMNFIPNPENKRTVNHDFGDTFDNRACVLSWATDSEQNIHAYKTGLRRIGEKHPQAKLSDADIVFIRTSKMRQFELVKKFNVSSGYICNLLKNDKYRKNAK